MNFAAAALVLLLVAPADAAPTQRKILPENAELIVTISVAGPGGSMTGKSRVQAQSQFNTDLNLKGKSPRKLIFNGVPVINPNNGKVRLEFKGRASWHGEDILELQSAVELELGVETVVYDTEGVVVKIMIAAADRLPK